MTKQIRYTSLLLTLYLLLTGCSSPITSDPLLTSVAMESVPIKSTVVLTPPVEYGASLDEWDAVVEDASSSLPANESPVVASEAVEDTSSAPLTEEPLVVVSEATAVPTLANAMTLVEDDPYTEIMWDSLIPDDYSAEAIMEKYAPQLALIEDGSPAASELYTEMQQEFNNAPVNEEISGELIKLPGFIAPLEYENDLIVEFLLVPYFGACIHTPAPPVNQTVLVRTAEGNGIKIEDSYQPIWIKGALTTENSVTTLAESGYYMVGATIEPYSR